MAKSLDTVWAPAGFQTKYAVAFVTAKKAIRSGAMWGYFYGICVAASAISYSSTYKTPADRYRLVISFGSNSAMASLFGPAHHLDTVAGFTSYKVLGFLSILGAVWGLSSGTRLLRGEEDGGRWELLLAGQTTRARAAAQGIAGLGAGLACLFVVTAVVTVVTGRFSKVHFALGDSVFFALALCCSAAVFLALGALASQVAPTRRQAAVYAGYLFGAFYILRMVADAGVGLHWMAWLSPLGWVEMLVPLTGSDWVPLLPVTALVIVVSTAAVHLAGRRDYAASVFPDRSTAELRPRLLNGSFGLTARMVRPTALTWAAALAIVGLIFGFISKPAGVLVGGSSSISKVLAHLGAKGAGAKAYLGVTFLMMAIMMVFVASGQVTAMRAEEAEGRLDHLLVRPVSRSAWLIGRAGQAAVAVVLGGLITGGFAWLGAASGHAGLRIAGLMAAGLNVAPPALLVLGVGVLAFGMLPRATSVAVYSVIVWSILIELVGGLVGSNHWILDTSIFHQMAPAPAVHPDWMANAVLVAIGLAAALVGVAGFHRRDLEAE